MAVSKKTGRKSLAANDHLIPLPPGPPTATDVGTDRPFDNGAALVSFSLTETTPPTVSYTVTSSSASDPVPKTATGTTSPILVTGLKSNTLYTFTVVGYTAENVPSDPSDPSTNTLITTVPATPAAPTATSPSAGSDTVSWTIPASGGKTITGYIWTASDGKTNLAGGSPGGGPTINTSVSVSQEQGTAQTYTVRALNANGTSLTSAASNSVTTTFSFAPFGAFGFSPFGAFGFSPFGFSPFGAFGFSPFGAFGFSPFGFSPFKAFGFSPFGAFSFIPFKAFGFSPFVCIAPNTLISAIDEDDNLVYIKAKDIKVGTRVFSPVWDEFEGDEIVSPYESIIKYDSLTNMRLEPGYVLSIKKKIVDHTVIINSPDKEFSPTQPVLVRKPGDLDSWIFAQDVEPGDIIWEYDFDKKQFIEVLVSNVEKRPGDEYVYAFDVEDIDTFLAGNIVCHNRLKG